MQIREGLFKKTVQFVEVINEQAGIHDIGIAEVRVPTISRIPDVGAFEDRGAIMAEKTVNFSLTVTTEPDFSLAISPTTLSVAKGTAAVFNVTTSAVGGYVSSIALSVTGLPAGVSAVIAPASIPQNGTATVTIPTTAIPVGTLALVLHGVGA